MAANRGAGDTGSSNTNSNSNADKECTSKRVELEVDCLKGDWGLPSISTKCLHALACARFAGTPLKINTTTSLWTNLNAEFPVFHTATADCEIIQALQLDLDYSLTDQQRADTLAFKSLMEERFVPGFLYSWWIDAKNYVEFTRPWYANAFHFPFNLFIPGRLQRSVAAQIDSTRGGAHADQQDVINKVYCDAKECMNLLSERLGNEDFFFGENPSSIDALVFSYLAPLLQAPLPSSSLQTHLKGTENLCAFCNRILLRYFSEERQDSNPPKPPPPAPSDGQFDDPHKTRNKILSLLFATVAMLGYSFMSGLVEMPIGDSANITDEQDYDDGEDG